jgi:hypothetical protein
MSGRSRSQHRRQAVAAGACNVDLDDPAERRVRRRRMHRLKPGRPPDELPRLAPALFEQHRGAASHEPVVEGLLIGFEARLKPRQTVGLFRFVDLPRLCPPQAFPGATST